MRLPNKPNDTKTHYLTNYYAKEKFGLPLVPFNNADDNAFVKFYNMEPLPIKGTHFHSFNWFLKLCRASACAYCIYVFE